VSSGSALWYLTRGSGVVALALLTASTVMGVLTAGRWRSERWPRFAVAALHRNLTLVVLCFVGIHVATTIADGYAPIAVKDVFVPFGSRYRPLWVGLGAVALDLLLAIAISSALRKRIGYRAWRLLHWVAYATWPLALAHGLGTGSDARYGWLALLSLACLALVLLAVTGRLLQSREPKVRLLAGGATLAAAVTLAAWYAGGPSKPGWAARAGTPASLLKPTRAAVSATSRRRLASAHVSTTFAGRLVGHMSSSGPDGAGDAAIAIAAATRGGEPGIIRLTLWGSALEGGGLAMTRSQASFVDARSGAVYTGSVVGLDGTLVVADVDSTSGATLRLVMRLKIDSTTGSVTGTVQAAPHSSSGAHREDVQ
jgi:methionine sulfoxide reductase heme-binding subunit